MSWVFAALVFGAVEPPAEPVREVATCPRIFGTAEDRKNNGKQRKAWVKRVTFGEESVDIVHFSDFTEPKRLALNGIEVVVDPDRKLDGSTWVTLEPALATEGNCLPGLYRVSADDNLGIGTAIIAADDGILVLHREDALWYLIPDSGKEPVFRSTWEARFTLPRSFTSSPAPANPPPRPRGK